MTDYVYLTGKIKWPRLVRPDPKFDNWGVNIYLDKKSQTAFDESGLQLSIKTDEDGEFIKVSRAVQKQIKGELVVFEAPKVIDKEGQALNGDTVGNGSRCTVKVAVFDTKKGKGHRLEAVQVLDLVPFEPKGREGTRF